jgi:D-glycero-D-manno-heptose 1,7-bisphosphate phosphatase
MLRYLRCLPGAAPRPALFLDRDGVLNRPCPGGYVTSPEQFELLDDVLDAARAAQAAGAALVVVTNQGAIARRLASEKDVEAIHRLLIEALAVAGITLDAIYVCPHHPLAPVEALRRCRCRKPKPGLITQALHDLNLDVRRSTLIGDHQRDMEAARAAGILRPLLVSAGTPNDLRRAVLANLAATAQPLAPAAGRAR